MPTALRRDGFRFFFYSNENAEPPHIHVAAGEATAKFWLSPVSLARSRGFRSHELSKLRALVDDERETFLEAWHEHFGGGS